MANCFSKSGLITAGVAASQGLNLCHMFIYCSFPIYFHGGGFLFHFNTYDFRLQFNTYDLRGLIHDVHVAGFTLRLFVRALPLFKVDLGLLPHLFRRLLRLTIHDVHVVVGRLKRCRLRLSWCSRLRLNWRFRLRLNWCAGIWLIHSYRLPCLLSHMLCQFFCMRCQLTAKR